MDEEEDPVYTNHLLRVCSAIGGEVDGEFVPGDEAIGCWLLIKNVYETSRDFYGMMKRKKVEALLNCLGNGIFFQCI